MRDFIDSFVSPTPAVSTGVVVSAVNGIGMSLPTIINVLTAVYLALAAIHKGWQMYRYWKGLNESSK